MLHNPFKKEQDQNYRNLQQQVQPYQLGSTSKRKLAYVLAAVSLVLIVAVGTIILIKKVNNTTKTTDTSAIKKQADSDKTKAIEALKNNDNDKAKELFKQSNEGYKEANDINNIVDTRAQLCSLGQKEYCNPIGSTE